LAAGSVFLVIMLDKRSLLDDRCPDPSNCPPEYQDDIDSYKRFKVYTTIGLVTGVVGAAAGVTLLYLEPAPGGPHVSAFVGPGSLGVRGRF
jgi:hypothetical protein